MRFASLHAGCGALPLGLADSGHEPVLIVESDPSATRVLQDQFRSVQLGFDEAEVDALPQGTCMLTSSLRTKDSADDGTVQLLGMDHTMRLLRLNDASNCPIQWVVLEGSSSLLEAKIRGMESAAPIAGVFDMLEGLGYHVAARAVDPRGWGLPLKGLRVMVVASLHGDPRDVCLFQRGTGLGEPLLVQSCTGSCQAICEERCYACHHARLVSGEAEPQGISIDLRATEGPNRCPQLDIVNDGQLHSLDSTCVIRCDGTGDSWPRLLDIAQLEVLHGLPSGWTVAMTQESLDNDADAESNADAGGLSPEMLQHTVQDQKRLVADSIPVPIAAWVGKNLTLRYQRGKFLGDATSDQPLRGRRGDWPLATYSLASERFVATGLGEFPILHKFTPLFSLLTQPSGDRVPVSQLRQWSEAVKLGVPQQLTDLLSSVDAESDDSKPLGRPEAKGSQAFAVAQYDPAGSENSAGTSSCVEWTAPDILGETDRALDSSSSVCRNEQSVLLAGIGTGAGNFRQTAPVLFPRATRTGVAPALIPLTAGEVAFVLRRGRGLWPAVIFDLRNSADRCFVPELLIGTADAANQKSCPGFAACLLGTACSWTTVKRQAALPYNSYRFIACEGRRRMQLTCSRGTADFEAALREADMRFQAHSNESTTSVPLGVSLAGCSSQAAHSHQATNGWEAKQCGKCHVCLTATDTDSTPSVLYPPLSISMLCMRTQAHVAALQGHEGAQLAVTGTGAVGAVISVFWHLENNWFVGEVVDFSPEGMQHTVLYEDGETESTWIWARLVRQVQPARPSKKPRQRPAAKKRSRR